MTSDAAAAAERRLLRLLARRPRSRAELARRLEAWAVPAADADAVLARLERAGLVDDAALARWVAESRLRRGRGSAAIAADLARLGVGGEDAAGALEAAADGGAAAARALVAARFGTGPLSAADARRAGALLRRRGFDDDAIAAALGGGVHDAA
jgi:regulatory protein